MKNPVSIYSEDFNEDSIGYALEEDIEYLYSLNKGTVLVPKSGNLKYIPILRRTNLELIESTTPKEDWLKMNEEHVKNLPKVNENRLAFIKETRGHYYKDLEIHPLACIGEAGMGFEWDNGWLEFPQRGGVTLGNNIRVGAFTSIKKGTIEDTVIGDGTKIGSHCNIGHNTKIGRDCLITHRVSIAGSCEVGDRVVFWQCCKIAHKVKIGDGAIIAQGSNVLKDVPPNTLVKGLWA